MNVHLGANCILGQAPRRVSSRTWEIEAKGKLSRFLRELVPLGGDPPPSAISPEPIQFNGVVRLQGESVNEAFLADAGHLAIRILERDEIFRRPHTCRRLGFLLLLRIGPSGIMTTKGLASELSENNQGEVGTATTGTLTKLPVFQ